VPVGHEPSAISAGGGAVWVANSGDGTVSRLDAGSGKVIATVDVGSNPSDVAVSQRGVWVVVHPS
jgi:YVTN family beta-propeller protein